MLVFRTDASKEIGFGHLSRCAYLASLLKKESEILFCITPDKDAVRFLQEKRVPFCPTKAQKELQKKALKAIIFDLKKWGEEDLEWLLWAKKNSIKTVQIAEPDLDWQSTDLTIAASIEQLTPLTGSARLLCGPEYAILHHRCRHFHRVKRKYRKRVKNIFIALGGAVEYRQLRKIIDILSRCRFSIKIAPGFCAKKSSQKILRRIYPGIRFTGRPQSLARSFFEADLAVITPGLLAYEAAAVGTPALYFFKNRHQESSAETFERQGLGLKISASEKIPEKELIEKITSLSWQQRVAMGAKGKELVDARGVFRIIACFKEQAII